jgi:hypothetical protein
MKHDPRPPIRRDSPTLPGNAPPHSLVEMPDGGGHREGSPAVDESALRAGLARIERHPALAASPRLRRLLRYLYEETLAGRGAEIRQFSIAFDCYQLLLMEERGYRPCFGGPAARPREAPEGAPDVLAIAGNHLLRCPPRLR